MANEDNLKKGEPTQYRSGEEAARNGRKGGRASGAARKKKKAMKDTMRLLLSIGLPEDSKNYAVFRDYGLPDEDINYQAVVSYAMLQKAIKGNVRAAEFVRDTAGYNASEAERNAIAREELKLKRDQFEYEKTQNESGKEGTEADEWAELIGGIEDEENGEDGSRSDG